LEVARGLLGAIEQIKSPYSVRGMVGLGLLSRFKYSMNFKVTSHHQKLHAA